MNTDTRFWHRISRVLSTSLMGIIGLLLAVIACQQQLLVPLTRSAEPVAITYETDSQDSIEWQIEAASRKQGVALPKARLTIQYVNNETELFRPAEYTVRLWYFGSTEPVRADRNTIDALGTESYNKPSVTITRKMNGRAYTRRTVRAGWYLAEYDREGFFYKVNAMANSDGLLVYNEHNTDAPMLSGYYPAYGKIKFTFGAPTGMGTQAFLTLTQGTEFQRLWLYAADATGKTKSVSWFMPVGSYEADWFKSGGAHKTGTITIAPGKRYPILKL